MVDPHHITPLAYEAVWDVLKRGEALSAVKDGAHLFTFRLRPAAPSGVTPATVRVLVDSRYFDAGWLRPGARQLESLRKTMRQADPEGFERQLVYRLFDEYLLRGRLSPQFQLIEREIFDVENARAYALAKPDIYRDVYDTNNKGCLQRIRNCGSLSPAQEAVILDRIRRRGPKSQSEQDRARAQHQQEQDIARNERRKWRELNGEDYEDEYNE